MVKAKPKHSPLSVYVSPELYNRLAQLCQRLNKNRSAVLRQLVEQACEHLEAELAALEAAETARDV